MNDLFAVLYEVTFGIYSEDYRVIFNTLFNESGYTYLGLSFILPPLIMFIIFYYVWTYPYGKLWHWVIWLFLCSLLTLGLTWALSNELIFNSSNNQLIDLIANPQSGYEDYALTLPLKYAFWNAGLSLILGVLLSLVLKQFSKVQIHLPI
ncbi:hypothetical protein LB456_09060 [Psychroflexus sp. CAK57W]|uniref:hypothetical protein n=1 Tax=Psychroflexus curvus TaxID=2873595 RepID=UPI001CCC0A80|nr:hypothetical protein [Psychroflexus curvus]MBZ9787603.1 hypothetical protein [Psychroflexus curvus]